MFSSLLNKQKEIVFEKSGKFVVRACPGSGKTYSVAARLAHRIKNWEHKRKGIVALSFTNAAWQEIDHQLEIKRHTLLIMTLMNWMLCLALERQQCFMALMD